MLRFIPLIIFRENPLAKRIVPVSRHVLQVTLRVHVRGQCAAFINSATNLDI